MPKAFQFRLGRLLDFRRLREDLARHELARACGNRAAQNQLLLDAVREDDEEKAELRALRARELDVAQLRLHDAYVNGLERRLRRESDRLQVLSSAEAEKRHGLTQAMKDVRILERLRDRQLKTHHDAMNREEQKFLDEVGQRSGKRTS